MRAKLRFNAIVFLILISVTACGASPQVKKARYLAAGDKFLAKKEFRNALIEYSKALRIDANDKKVYVKIATVFSAVGDIKQSLSNLKKANGIDPRDMDIRLKIAEDYALMRKPDNGRNELDFILHKDPKNTGAAVLLSEFASTPAEIEESISQLKGLKPGPSDVPRVELALGGLYAKKGDPAKALDYFQRAIKANPSFPEAYVALGDLAVRKSDFTEAEKEYVAAARLTPADSPVHLKLADFYLFRKNPAKAKEVLEAVLKKFPGFSPALHRLAAIALEGRRFDECDKYLKIVLKNNPSDLNAKTTHARMLLAQNHTAQAAAELEQVVNAAPGVAIPKYFLGLAYMKEEQVSKAKEVLQKAVGLAPDFTPAVLLLADAYVHSGDFRAATDSLTALLGKAPGNLNGYLLLAQAARTPADVKNAISLLEKGRQYFKNDSKFELALGGLYLEANNAAKAQPFIKNVLAREPGSMNAHLEMGDCFFRENNRAQAEQEYIKAVSLSQTASIAQIKLAEFYLMDNKTELAKKILSEAVAGSPGFLPAKFLLAKIAFVEKDYDRSAKLLDDMLAKKPDYVDALLLRGQLNLVRKKTAQALSDFHEALKINPASEGALELMGLAYLKQEDIGNARSSFKQLLTIDPNLYGQRVQLAQLDIQSGDFQSAIDNLQVLINRGEKEPVVYLLLGTAYLGNNNPGDAKGFLEKYLKEKPKDGRGSYLYGLALKALGKQTEAVGRFEEALHASPPVKEALAQLVSTSIAEKKLDSALKYVTDQIGADPKDVGAYMLLGQVRYVRKETSQAEAAWLKALSLNPGSIAVHLDLAQLYAGNNKLDKAFSQLNDVIAKDPKNVGALMLSGVLYQGKGDIPKARKAYEALLAINPAFAPAANNLAYIYCEYDHNYDKALSLAQTARQQAPADPNIADTLGWVLYNQKNYSMALTYLKEGAAKLPGNADIQYHLGMTQYRLGDVDAARQALNTALEKGGASFKEAARARQALGEMAKMPAAEHRGK
ncbi:MAG: tetratricopeptide repeat protein [Syntrophobacteraceae bacterium]|nr:tetratricopeptide repeat protein [Syntrophobacteraceae bacterium]